MTEWTSARGLNLDGLVSVAQLAGLARHWYRDRLAPDWQPRSRDASQALIDAVGLAGPFWTLPG